MSKLFDTLEKIRKSQEKLAKKTAAQKGTNTVAPIASFSRPVIMGLSLLACIAIGLYAYFPSQSPSNTAQSSQEAEYDPAFETESPTVDPEMSEGSVSGSTRNNIDSTSPDSLIAMNNQGAALVAKEKHHEAVYFFSKASELDPERIEPVINLAVTYSEIGLYKKAIGYFERAYELDPVNPTLLENIQILHQAKLLKSSKITQESFQDLISPNPDLDAELQQLQTDPNEDV